MRPNTSYSKLVARLPVFVWSKEEVDAAVGPVHVAGAALESLFATDCFL